MPVAEDVKQQTAVSIQEQGEDFPAVLVEPQNVRAYPSPYGINAAGVLGYLSPITSDELDDDGIPLAHRTDVQVAAAVVVDGHLVCDRDADPDLDLRRISALAHP